MYLPKHFEETRAEELHRVMREYPLGILVLNGPNGLDAHHLPFELNPNIGACGHLLAQGAGFGRFGGGGARASSGGGPGSGVGR